MAIQGSVGKGGKNNKPDVKLVQGLLNRGIRVPYRLLDEDGYIGPRTLEMIRFFQAEVVGVSRPDERIDVNGKTWNALSRYTSGNPGYQTTHFLSYYPPKQAHNAPATPVTGAKQIAWGAKVSKAFKDKVIRIAGNLKVNPDYLMACIAFESGASFSPSIKNAAGSGATGLIQFMPTTAKHLGTTVDALAKMTAVAQLDYVEKYFKMVNKPLKTLEDVYLSILYPAAVGRDPNSTLFKKGKKTYEQNSGFDANKDGTITPAEISVKVRGMYNKGLQKGFIG